MQFFWFLFLILEEQMCDIYLPTIGYYSGFGSLMMSEQHNSFCHDFVVKKTEHIN